MSLLENWYGSAEGALALLSVLTERGDGCDDGKGEEWEDAADGGGKSAALSLTGSQICRGLGTVAEGGSDGVRCGRVSYEQ